MATLLAVAIIAVLEPTFQVVFEGRALSSILGEGAKGSSATNIVGLENTRSCIPVIMGWYLKGEK